MAARSFPQHGSHNRHALCGVQGDSVSHQTQTPSMCGWMEPPKRPTTLDLERDLLGTQLKDLDSWCTQQRLLNIPGAPPEGDVAESELHGQDIREWVGVESLLQAQLHEIDAWLSELHGQEKLSQDDGPTPTTDGDLSPLMFELGRERRHATRRFGSTQVGGETGSHMGPLAQLRVQSAHDAIRKLRDARTQSTLALEKIQSVRLQSTEDFGVLRSQLDALANDPSRAPELSQYATTDVALGFVSAIEQRLALAREMNDALRLRSEARLAAELHEQLLACGAAEDLMQEVSFDGRVALTAPAARLAFETNSDPAGNMDQDDPLLRRCKKLAETNRELWFQYAKLQDAKIATAQESAALHSELKALRSAEVRLDSLMTGGVGAGKLNSGIYIPNVDPGEKLEGGQMWASTNMIIRVAGDRLDAAEGRLAHILKRQLADDMGVRDLETQGQSSVMARISKAMVGASRSDILWAWFRTSKEMRATKAKRRRDLRKKWLCKRGPTAWAFWFLVSGLLITVERPLPTSVRRFPSNPRVLDKESGCEGRLLSMTSEGMCKVAFGEKPDTAMLLLPAMCLLWLQEVPHPSCAWIAFVGWATLVSQLSEISKVKFRQRMDAFPHGAILGDRMLFWLKLLSFDSASLVSLAFAMWKRSISKNPSKDCQRMAALSQFWQAWRQSVYQGRHLRTVQELQKTNKDLHIARVQAMRDRCYTEKLKKRLFRLDAAEDMVWKASVFSAWQFATAFALESARLQKEAELARLAAYNKGMIAAYRICGMQKRKQDKRAAKMCVVTWKRWCQAHKRKELVHRAMEYTGFLSIARAAFQRWFSCALATKQAKIISYQTEYIATSQELVRLQTLSKQLYHFGTEADQRVNALEDALRAADVAMHAGARQFNALAFEEAEMQAAVEATQFRIQQTEEKMADSLRKMKEDIREDTERKIEEPYRKQVDGLKALTAESQKTAEDQRVAASQAISRAEILREELRQEEEWLQDEEDYLDHAKQEYDDLLSKAG